MRRNRLYRKISNILNNIKFKFFNLDYGEIIILFGIIFSVISLFSTWVDDIRENPVLGPANGFSDRTGSPGYFILIIVGIIIFNIFSKQKKEKMKLYGNIHFDNNGIYINSGILISIISILCLNFISGLSSLDSQNIYGKGPIICLTGGVAILIGGFLLRKNNNFKINTFIDDTDPQANKENFNKENNMKLPF